MPWIILLVVFAVIMLILAYPRISLKRKPNVQGIEDKAAVAAYSHAMSRMQYYIVQPLILNALKKYRPQGTLVNIGCGPGYLDAVLAKKLPRLQVIGMDIDREMIKTARRNLLAYGLSERVAFQVSDVHHLPFKDGGIGFIVSTFSLHHWSDVGLALSEIYRVLKPEGQFLLFDLRRDSRRWWYWGLQIVEVFTPRPLKRIDGPMSSLFASHTPQEMGALLSRSPFKKWRVKGQAGWMAVWGQK